MNYLPVKLKTLPHPAMKMNEIVPGTTRSYFISSPEGPHANDDTPVVQGDYKNIMLLF